MLGGGYSFSQVPIADIPRSVFNRSHGHKTTFNEGYLIPIYCDEALPGDTFTMGASALCRLATPIVPMMDNMHLDFFFFAVPNRLLWANWQKFMGEQENPGDSTDFLVPEVVAPVGGFPRETLYDYFGVPCGVEGLRASALFGRAYNRIWNEWFRDENLQQRRPSSVTDGPDPHTDYDDVAKRGKRHDYFTSCLPWPQKGPGVQLPIGETANVIAKVPGVPPTFMIPGLPVGSQDWRPIQTAGAVVNTPSNLQATPNAGQTITAGSIAWGDTNLVADLAQATAATINSLRQAFQIQRLLERDARGGTRYTEILRSHFGVVSPDARLQRPEYLGGGSIPLMINPVTQTSGSAGAGGYTDTPQGNLAAYGVAGGHGIGFSKSFVEHCIIIGLVSARADLSYQQGMNRMFSRRSRYDFYWPAFSHLGEQAVLNKEIYAQGTAGAGADDAVFGYQERWAEYRYFPSKITGKFNSTSPTPLDFWHLAQHFTALPVLGSTFIEDSPPVDRVVAVPSEPHFILDMHFRLKCVRPMPTYSVPGMIDHF